MTKKDMCPPKIFEKPNRYSSVDRSSAWSHTVRQWHDRSLSQAPPMLVCKDVVENNSATMLAAKRSTGVTLKVNSYICLQQV